MAAWSGAKAADDFTIFAAPPEAKPGVGNGREGFIGILPWEKAKPLTF
jgi:hypothetical protein